MTTCTVCEMNINDDEDALFVHRRTHIERENRDTGQLYDAMFLDRFNSDRLHNWEGRLRAWETALQKESIRQFEQAMNWQQAFIDAEARPRWLNRLLHGIFR